MPKLALSGSGKTTLLKLLLRFYEPTAGSFLVGKVPLTDINPRFWRRRCGSDCSLPVPFTKTPSIFFFDEATNSLHTNNEAIIINNLDDFFRGSSNDKEVFKKEVFALSEDFLSPRTVVIVAHRLSIVKNVDQIVVME